MWMNSFVLLCFILVSAEVPFINAYDDKYIRFGPNNTIKIRLCPPAVAYDCLIAKHFDTECMTKLNIIYGVDAKSMKLELQDSHRKPFADCIYRKIKPLTKDPEINHDIYLPQKDIESEEMAQKFENIYKQLSNRHWSNVTTSTPLEEFKFCRLEKITKCFREQECVMKLHHNVLLNVFDDCKNITTSSNLNEKNQLSKTIGNYSLTVINNIKKYAQLDDDFKDFLCSK